MPSLAFLDLSRGCAGSCSAPRSRPRSARSTTSAACAGGRSSADRSLAASIPPIFGIWIDHFTFPFLGVYDLSPWVGGPLTVLWIVAVMNMVNFLDGLDGLAAGVCGIAGGTFTMIALSLGKPTAAAFSAIVFGATLGFLRHNFFPARIFMGDSGAMLLGFSLAAVSVEGLLKTAATVALFFPLLVLAVPILDTGFVVARRLKYRMPITAPDKTHLHHRFVNIGFSQPRAVAYIYFWVATLAAAALGTRYIPFREDGAGTCGRRSARSRSACSRWPRRSTWSTCSRSSSWRTRASAVAAGRRRSGSAAPPSPAVTGSAEPPASGCRTDRGTRRRSRTAAGSAPAGTRRRGP